jgi:hypothetical protein
MLRLSKRKAEFLEKSGRFITPREKQLARFRMLKNIVEKSNTVLAFPAATELYPSRNSAKNFSQS